MTLYPYHFFDKRTGPFRSLSAFTPEVAEQVLQKVKRDLPNSMCALRDAKYVAHRRDCEAMVREAFADRGGIVENAFPYYMVVEFSPWLSTWYEQSEYIKVPVEMFDVRTLSFTYGDSMPTFSDRCADGREYRKRVYTYEEILSIIEKYDLPQNWNDDGRFGPERYIEVQVWSEKTVNELREAYSLLNETGGRSINEQVNEYISKYPTEVIELFNNLRQLIFESVPNEPEEKLWAKLPSYYVGEAFVRLIPFKDHINIEVQTAMAHKDELAGYKITPKGMVQIHLKQAVPSEILKRIFAETLK